jgi:hypothetical protein
MMVLRRVTQEWPQCLFPSQGGIVTEVVRDSLF